VSWWQKDLVSDKMSNFNYINKFGSSFVVLLLNINKEENNNEYMDNFYSVYGPELGRKLGFEIEIQKVFKNTCR